MGKSYFLSAKDDKKIGQIDFFSEMIVMPENELKKIILVLKKIYNINQPVLNIIIDPWSKNRPELDLIKKEAFSNKTSAADVYMRVMTSLCNYKGKKNTKQNKKYRAEYHTYLLNHVKRCEKYIQDNRDENTSVNENLLMLLTMLERDYRRYMEKGNLKTTYKLYKLYYKKFHNLSILNPFEQDDYSNYKSSFINEILNINEESGRDKFFFGDNDKLLESYISALVTSDDPYPILILGETGTGKEKLARRIHEVSVRKDNSFQPLNCAAIPETLFDSEISGIIKGTATSVSTRLGIFLAACHKNKNGYWIKDKDKILFHNKKWEYEPTESELREVGGTVFFDEINSIPMFLQAKLLRIIEENEVRVVGEERSRKFNIKLICASNTDLYNEVREGVFREDLYHRISGQILRLPSLREMKESLVEIAQHKLSEIVNEIGYNKKVKFSKSAGNKIQNYDWPGNFRELNNILYRALNEVRLEGKNIINGSNIVFPASFNQPQKTIDNFLPDMQFEDLEKRYIIAIMKKAGGNETKAAKMAGFGNSRTPLQTRLKKYGIKFKK